VTQPPPDPAILAAPPLPESPKTSGLAVASLICAIAGLCTCGVGGLVGLVLSIVAMRRIKRSEGELEGRGVALAGLVVSIIAIVIGAAIIAGTAAFWLYAKPYAEREYAVVQFRTNVEVLCRNAMEYSAVHDGRLPPPDSWPRALMDVGLITDLDFLADPADPGAGRAVAMNRAVALAETYDVTRAGETVLFFECRPGSPLSGGRDLLPPEPRRPAGYVIGFLDGRVRMMTPERLDHLVWNPEPEQPLTGKEPS